MASRALTAGIMALFAALLATAALQAHRNAPVQASDRQSLITQIDARKAQLSRLSSRVARLNRTVADLTAEGLSSTQAGRGTDATLTLLGVAAGTTPVTGPGIRITVDDAPATGAPGGTVLDRDLQVLVNGLWSSGRGGRRHQQPAGDASDRHPPGGRRHHGQLPVPVAPVRRDGDREPGHARGAVHQERRWADVAVAAERLRLALRDSLGPIIGRCRERPCPRSATHDRWRCRRDRRTRPRPGHRPGARLPAGRSRARCSPTCRSPSSLRSTPSSAALRAYLDGIFDNRVFVISFISNVLIAGLIVYLGDQLGRGRPALDRRHRGPGDPDLLQRGRHPTTYLRRMSGHAPAPRASPTTGLDATTVPAASGRVSDRRRLLRALLRPGKGQVIAAVLLLALGYAAVTQVRAHGQSDSYAGARQSDLVTLLNSLSLATEPDAARGQPTDRDARLPADRLQRQADRPRSRQAAGEHAWPSSPARSPWSGPGVRVTIHDSASVVSVESLLNGVSELRDAGAEAIAINGTRVVASTAFEQDSDGGHLVVGGSPLQSPYVIDVIGDPQTLKSAVSFEGGFAFEVRARGRQAGRPDLGRDRDRRGRDSGSGAVRDARRRRSSLTLTPR